MTGSADNEAYIYSTSTYAPCRPVAKLSGHTNDVTCVAFSKQVADPYKIATTADDFDVRCVLYVQGAKESFASPDYLFYGKLHIVKLLYH